MNSGIGFFLSILIPTIAAVLVWTASASDSDEIGTFPRYSCRTMHRFAGSKGKISASIIGCRVGSKICLSAVGKVDTAMQCFDDPTFGTAH